MTDHDATINVLTLAAFPINCYAKMLRLDLLGPGAPNVRLGGDCFLALGDLTCQGLSVMHPVQITPVPRTVILVVYPQHRPEYTW